MSNEEEMRAKFSAIGARYLARTAVEIGDLEKLVAKLLAGNETALKEIEILSHRIRGSGAVFGFAKLSDIAGVIEMLAVDSASVERYDATQLTAQFNAQIERLKIETQQAISVAQKT